MRWMWIDRVLELEAGRRIVTLKNVTLAEEHLHDHFASVPSAGGRPGRQAMPVMPACLIIEGMAQSGGVLVGHAGGFKEKVLLAKIARAELEREAVPGDTLRYTTTIQSMSAQGASTQGLVELRRGSAPDFRPIGRVDLMFSHADNAMDLRVGGVVLPRENFVFCESFATLLRMSGFA